VWFFKHRLLSQSHRTRGEHKPKTAGYTHLDIKMSARLLPVTCEQQTSTKKIKNDIEKSVTTWAMQPYVRTKQEPEYVMQSSHEY